MDDRKNTDDAAYEANASHGQNRAGVALGDNESFEDYVGAQPIDPHRADELVEDEGPEIRARMHARGNDVVVPPEPDGETAADATP